jgi:hypothetical protein
LCNIVAGPKVAFSEEVLDIVIVRHDLQEGDEIKEVN